MGRALAERLGMTFNDTDRIVAALAGMPVEEIFEKRDEQAFRDLESGVIAALLGRDGQVIATGGGAVLREENVRRLRAGGILVRLHARPEVVIARVGAEGLSRRPLLAGDPEGLPARVGELMGSREELYAVADHAVDTSERSVDEVVDEIVARLEKTTSDAGKSVSQEMRVELGDRSYPILVGEGVLPQLGPRVREVLGEGGSNVALLVTHPGLDAAYGAIARESLEGAGFNVATAILPPGEETKSLDHARYVYDRCVDSSLDRTSPIIALGGGVVGDLAGFVAATYMRGVPFIQVPTTLLSQVDAGVGGKVAVNHPRAKNMIGAFYQPSLVLADVATLRTLPARDYLAGLAEVIKHGVIADPEYFDLIECRRRAIRNRMGGIMVAVVAGSCRIKAAVVQEDERESHRRMILNFGHTVAHALESETDYKRFLHGEAVAIGMVAAGHLALDPAVAALFDDRDDRSGHGGNDGAGSGGDDGENGWTERDQGRLEDLLAAYDLPVRIPDDLDVEGLLIAMTLDKKSRAGRINWVIPRRVGRVEIIMGVPEESVRRVLGDLGAVSP